MPAALIAQAREWVGVKFLHQGRTRLGCDCLGLIAGVLGELGDTVALAALPQGYGRDPQAQLLERLTSTTTIAPLQAGVLLLIQWPQTEFPSHAAIYTGSSMIHSYAAVGKVVEHGYREPWVRRTVSVWALPSVAYV